MSEYDTLIRDAAARTLRVARSEPISHFVETGVLYPGGLRVGVLVAHTPGAPGPMVTDDGNALLMLDLRADNPHAHFEAAVAAVLPDFPAVHLDTTRAIYADVYSRADAAIIAGAIMQVSNASARVVIEAMRLAKMEEGR